MSRNSLDRQQVLDDLLSEKNLWAIYKASRRISFSTRNLWGGVLVGILGTMWSLYAKSPKVVADQLQSLATMSFETSVGLLGFLLAGFSFFATVFDKKMFCRMAEVPHAPSGLSYLKYNFFSFMRVFCEYFALALISLGLSEVLASQSGARLWLSELMNSVSWPDRARLTVSPKLAAVSAVYGIFLGALAYLLMQLNSFIFNIYHVSMSSVRWALGEEYANLASPEVDPAAAENQMK